MSNIEKNARKRKNKIVVCIVLTVLVIAFVGIDLFLFLSLKDRINNDNTAQKRENTNSDFICRVTGLSLDEVEKLRKGL